ncbi:hypothetical protein [Cardinium endosymbiont of Sogatella furcifera]|uniref:hypothetical protein n=1 Tax=Cardinium endosymbiont of Sogatella furcifera TaxID=650378 RepID=UPI000E0D1A2C|nr:hypothetical protein [Cardinium endosymbiont of Sogatella furcifera]
MAYVQQAAWFWALMLLLQASICSRKRCRPASTPIPVATIYKKLCCKPCASDHAPEEKEEQVIDFNPEFGDDDDCKIFNPKVDGNVDNKMHSDSNGEGSAGYDSGYDSDKDADKDASATPKAKQPPSSVSDLKKHNIIFDFERIIEKMRKEADRSRNIHCKFSGDRLIRTVKDEPNDQHSLYAAEDYVIQGLNIYRAAKKICVLYEQDPSAFEVKAHEFLCYYSDHLEKPEAFWINKIKEINQGVVTYLYKKGFLDANLDAINNNLRIAENYVGLDDTHYNVTTKFKIEGKEFALEDTKWPPLTATQKEAYRNRKSEKYYTRLDPFEQKFIDAYKSELGDDKHYIPTQIRTIPGCRNAYQKRIIAYDQNNHPTVLGRYYHSGSLPSPIQWTDKKTDQKITQDNWAQVQQQDKNVEVISLNYNMDIKGFEQLREKKIVEDTRQVVGNDRFMNLSINGIGTSFNLKNQYNKLLEDSITWYTKNSTDPSINFKKDPKDKSFFMELEKLGEAAQTPELLNNLKQITYISDNPNATTCASYIACKAILSQADPSTTSVLFCCKSGKDRTGIISYLTDATIICKSCPELDIDIDKVCKDLALTRHYQSLACINGGMPGRFGMKPVRNNKACNKFTELLFPRTAELTKIPLIR